MPEVETSYAGALALWALLRPKRQSQRSYRWLHGHLRMRSRSCMCNLELRTEKSATKGRSGGVKPGLPIVERFVGIVAVGRAVYY
jgi:hypothetical protein